VNITTQTTQARKLLNGCVNVEYVYTNPKYMEHIEKYVRENYKRLYGDKPLIIEEFDSHYTIKANKDESPLILGKQVGK